MRCFYENSSMHSFLGECAENVYQRKIHLGSISVRVLGQHLEIIEIEKWS